jgi:glycosyltransferase involved in cell wall biosynthesis
MKVSVVIPTYNSAATIQATLDSVLRQTVSPEEILVLDDGSTDNTFSLLNSYKPRITVFQERHKGASSAYNALCERASGDHVAFLEHDDIWHPNYLEVQLKLFKDYPNGVAFRVGHVNFYGYGNH